MAGVIPPGLRVSTPGAMSVQGFCASMTGVALPDTVRFGRMSEKERQRAEKVGTYVVSTAILVPALAMLAWAVSLLPLGRPGPASHKIGWPQNTKVLAATGEHHDARGSLWPGDSFLSTNYTHALVKLLKDPKVKSLGEAHRRLVTSGYPSFLWIPQYAMETPREIGGWQKGESRPRFVLILGQHETGSWLPAKQEKTPERFVSALREAFDVPEANIRRIPSAKHLDVKDALQWLSERVQDNPDAEVLIYYMGQGTAYHLNPDSPFNTWKDFPIREGDGEGRLVGPDISEATLKKLVQTYLGKTPNLHIILDAPNAGAWIA